MQAGKRERTNRISFVDGRGSGYGSSVPVLASNQYGLGHSLSVFDRELHGKVDRDAYGVTKRKVHIAGRDYDHERICIACFSEGEGVPGWRPCTFDYFGRPCDEREMLKCKLCPMVMHKDCAA
eukprot:4642988-Pleurochrysis_carterae.AAC.1